MTGREILIRVVKVREALTDGDLPFALRSLALLEADLARSGRKSSSVCPACGTDCEWPGLLEEHLRLHHPDEWEKTVAA